MHDTLKPIPSTQTIMKKQEKFIRANWRITKQQFDWVKKQAKKVKMGEAEFIRNLLDTYYVKK